MKKRILALVMAAALLATGLTGCSKDNGIDGSEVIAEVDGVQITADVANFYSRYQQAQYETYYAAFMGEDMWESDMGDDKNYEETVKDGLMEALQNMYVLDAHKEDYDVSISEEEQEAIKTAAEEFVTANGDEEKELVSGNQETIEKVLELITIQEKMYEAMIADVDQVVSDEEAAQKKMQYISLGFTTTDEDGNSVDLTEEELADLKDKAEEFQARAAEEDVDVLAEELDVDVSESTFDAESVSPSEEVVEAADALGEGEVTEVIETGSAYIVAKVVSLFDEEATETKKLNIISEREQEAYTELCDEWLDAAEITVHEEVWSKISFADQGITMKVAEEEEEPEDETIEDGTTDDGTGEQDADEGNESEDGTDEGNDDNAENAEDGTEEEPVE